MKEKDISKLESIDEYGSRKTIIPASVNGKFYRWRTITQFALILFFLILPWTKWAGKQTLWLDVANRQFTILGLTLGSHDAPLIFVFLIIGALSLALVTSIFGRVWCGWACPQTVFIEGIYRRIERFIEGDSVQRLKLMRSDQHIKKFSRASIKWLLFFVVSSIIAHSFAAYFAGAENLILMMQQDPTKNLNYFILITGITALLLFDFGWFKEQFCVIACPYGRIQSILMDEKSLSIVYDTSRGEPRKGVAKFGQKQGDCVSCFKCVNVCPTGIDIRNGQQMECIGCTACIDACDEIMTKINKPTGLIRYSSQIGDPVKLFRTRPILYFIGILISFSGLAYALQNRLAVDINLIRPKEMPFQSIPKTESTPSMVINHITPKLVNQSDDNLRVIISTQEEGIELISTDLITDLNPWKKKTVHIFLKFENKIDAINSIELNFEIINPHTLEVLQTKKMKVGLIYP